jgi:hypothetical protein
MIANQPFASPGPWQPKAIVASFEPPMPVPGIGLDVTDGLVSIGQQAWMDGLATSVLH